MLLILSKNSINEPKSIENMEINDHLSLPSYNPSLKLIYCDGDSENKQSIPKTLQDSLQTPSKKKNKGCTCKKIKCIKSYCECFAQGKLCTEECMCLDCCNVSQNREEINGIRTNRKHRNRNGGKKCTCKKSNCRKKYCECFLAEVPCGDLCKCVNCQNPEPKITIHW